MLAGSRPSGLPPLRAVRAVLRKRRRGAAPLPRVPAVCGSCRRERCAQLSDDPTVACGPRRQNFTSEKKSYRKAKRGRHQGDRARIEAVDLDPHQPVPLQRTDEADVALGLEVEIEIEEKLDVLAGAITERRKPLVELLLDLQRRVELGSAGRATETGHRCADDWLRRIIVRAPAPKSSPWTLAMRYRRFTLTAASSMLVVSSATVRFSPTHSGWWVSMPVAYSRARSPLTCRSRDSSAPN